MLHEGLNIVKYHNIRHTRVPQPPVAGEITA